MLHNLLFLLMTLLVSVHSTFTTKIDSIPRTKTKLKRTPSVCACQQGTKRHPPQQPPPPPESQHRQRSSRQTQSKHHKKNCMEPGKASHCEPDGMPPGVNLCKTAKVQLSGCNPKPELGLCHGSRATVIDIVFAPGQSPNNNDLPLCVLVDFPQCCGPVFEPQDTLPMFVPIAPIKIIFHIPMRRTDEH